MRSTRKDEKLEELGDEQVEDRSLYHLRLYRVWQPTTNAKATQVLDSDIWLDSPQGLPARISYQSTDASIPNASLKVTVEYSDYRMTEGMLYPFHIKQYLNGSLWADIQVQNVHFNTGLTDSDFSY